MTIPKKGARELVVDDVTYNWVVSQEPISGGNELRVTVEQSNVKGALLIVATGLTAWPTTEAITPKSVRAWIVGAIAQGWTPTKKGPPYIALPTDFAAADE